MLAISLATIAMVGSPAQRKPPANASPSPEPAESFALRAEGNRLFRAVELTKAIQLYRRGIERARARRDEPSELRFLNNLGGAEYKSFRYRDAIRSFLRVRELAMANRNSDRNSEMLAVTSLNLSSLYLEMNDVEGALQAAREGIAYPPTKYRAQLLTLTANILARQGKVDEAVVLAHEAIDVSRAQEDIALESQAWNELGAILLDAKRPGQAERPILEGYRLRRLHLRNDMQPSYLLLGRLHLQQGNAAGAQVFFDRAVEAAREAGPPALWESYSWRGRGLMEQSRWKDAYRDLQAALRYLRGWRAEVLPADAFRVSAETDLQQTYSAFIAVAAQLYRETGNRAFVEDALAASETNRASSLRALWAGGDLTANLPPEYGETLAELRRAETGILKNDSETLARDAARLRLRLAEMEARAGLDLPEAAEGELTGRTLVAELQRALDPREVLLAFHSGDKGFYCWAVTRERLQFSTISGAGSLEETVQRFVSETRERRPSASATASALYAQLFAGVDAALLAKPVWVVAPDGPLFELPFSALIESRTGDNVGRYVVENHAVREVPGIWAMRGPAVRTRPGPWVGVGDPIYNRADPRRVQGPKAKSTAASGQPASGQPASGQPLELARLMGSGREVDACARIWRARGFDAAILTGAGANRRNLLDAIASGPPVLHIATHILFPTNGAGPGMVALSEEPAGGVDLLNVSEIARLRARLDLVVLDGCSSGTGPVLPGTGLMGLTRAWLAAGARAIVVTRWPASDRDAGQLFQPFYENLVAARPGERVSFSQALQQAQIARLHAGGTGANPANWASYFCVERN